ncbi:putative WSC domain-containing protein [Seiridium unicorne]|uniref:WSC domain-containing protein n=1 Tax=Seiridium unicorne TaxID=138068 RepID=A0ABR2V1F4_9PEZI
MIPNISTTRAVICIVAFAANVDAFWRLPCSSPVVVERADPIMDPGVVSTHAHTVMGSNAFNFSMTYADTQTAKCSTCKVKQDQSNYWVPNLYYHAENGSFIPVTQSGGALIYYLQRQDEKDPEFDKGLISFQKDFRMIAGNPLNRNHTDSVEQSAVSFVCLGIMGPATPELPKQNCPGGLRTQLMFPSCWDGTNLDSPDHKSHMTYPTGVDNGPCPKTHPNRFITIFYEVTWNVDDFKDMWFGDRQPFVFSHGDPDGYGYHGDFLNGWDVETLQKAVTECTDNSGVIEKCGAFDLRTDDEMAACKVLPRVDEEVIDGVLAALPGCNPIQPGPEEAVYQHGCGAVNEIGDPVLPFTDMSKTLKWKYVGCVKDPAGQSRTLDGTQQDKPDMTVDACIKYCEGAGFSYAGLEYKTQCFCGNGVAEDRMPANGTTGQCEYKCGGDAKQICGGYGQATVYQKCSSDICENAKLE